MNLSRVTETELLVQKSTFLSLFHQIFHANFPGITKNDSYIEHLYNQLMLYVRDESALLFGAVDYERIVGFIWGYVIDDFQGKRIHVTEFAVDEAYRSQGIGHLLLQKIEETARKMQIDTIEIIASTSNERALHFYETNSFETTRVVMQKNLQIGGIMEAKE